MTSRESALRALADQLRAAEDRRAPIDALSSQLPDLTLAEAYRVQGINVRGRIAAGEALVGRKIGLTSKAMQEQLGVDQPDVGAIFDTMVIPHAGRVEVSRFIQPRLEAEVAFRMASDLPGPASMESVRAAVGSVMVAAEVIDSRIRDWSIGLVDTVADNASSAAVVFGPEVPAKPDLLDALPGIRVELRESGKAAASGLGSAILGHPLEAVVWLARTLEATGESLKEGDLVLAGAVHASIPLGRGLDYSVHGSPLPSLHCSTV